MGFEELFFYLGSMGRVKINLLRFMDISLRNDILDDRKYVDFRAIISLWDSMCFSHIS